MFILNLFVYIFSFACIWFGSGLIISAVSKFSSKLRLSPFAFSFVFLGILTSTPEFSVGLQAVGHNDPGIFVGNLLGGIIVLFLVVIPLLAIFGNGINLKHEMDRTTLVATLFVIICPSLFILDRRVTNFEGVLFILLYLFLVFLVERKNGIFDKKNTQVLNIKAYSYRDLVKVIVGVGIVFTASNLIVDQTLYFAKLLHISPFYIGLFVVALGTDLPELSLAVRSVVSGKRDIAMGDYIGAGAVSTLLFGVFTVLHNGEVITVSNFLLPFGFILTALFLFYYFSSTKQFLSRLNGFLMIGIYVLFIALELLLK